MVNPIIRTLYENYKKYSFILIFILSFLLLFLFRFEIIVLITGTEYKEVLPISKLENGYSKISVTVLEDSIYSISCNFTSLTEQKFIKWNSDTINIQSISCGIKLIFDNELYGYDSSVLEIKLDSSNTKRLLVTRIIPKKIGRTKIFFSANSKTDTLNVSILKRKDDLIVEENI